MIENYIVSCVILPHGITDLIKIKKNELPILLLVYVFSFSICSLFHDLFKYGHIVLFLISSMNRSILFLLIGKSVLIKAISETV